MPHDGEYGRGLAGPIGTKQRQNLSRFDREREVAHGDHLTVAAGEIPELEQRHRGLSF
jgi:hypothetical protein